MSAVPDYSGLNLVKNYTGMLYDMPEGYDMNADTNRVYTSGMSLDQTKPYDTTEILGYPYKWSTASTTPFYEGQVGQYYSPDNGNGWTDFLKALTLGATTAMMSVAAGPVIGGALGGALTNFANSNGEASLGDVLTGAGIGGGLGYAGSLASGALSGAGSSLAELGASPAYNPSLGNLAINGAAEYGGNLGSTMYGSAATPFIGAATSAYPALGSSLGSFYGTSATPLVTNGLMGNDSKILNDLLKVGVKAGTKALSGSGNPSVTAPVASGVNQVIQRTAPQAKTIMSNTPSVMPQQASNVSNIQFANNKLANRPLSEEEKQSLNGYLFKPENYLGKYLA